MAPSRLEDSVQVPDVVQKTSDLAATQKLEFWTSQPGKYPRWVSVHPKFTPDGAVLPFPGNTIICHLPQHGLLFQALLQLRDSVGRQPFASLFAPLPPTSWHMTIFEGVSDQLRLPGMWPADVPIGAPLEDATAIVRGKLQCFDLGEDPPFRMRVEGFEPLEDGIALKVVPADEAEERRIRGLRDRLSELLKARHPGHDTYSFHISLSYSLRFFSEEGHRNIWAYLQEWRSKLPETFELAAPAFCVFDDMFDFRRQFSLERRS